MPHRTRNSVGGILALAAVLQCSAVSQTTQGIILGRITDSRNGRAVVGASLRFAREDTGWSAVSRVDSKGSYAVPGLSPARYTVTVEFVGYQTQQARALDLPVAGRIELNFRLRPLYDLWEAGRYQSWILPQSQEVLSFYGPDVDTSRIAVFNANLRLTTPLDNSRSDVISQRDTQTLPLTGRDAYTLLMVLPGVTSDTATARGLGFSVNGQRPSASNYLLDGADNNNHLVTGPLSAVVPEFIQEYRISTSNYSAEYGKTSGFVANAITRSGTNRWHSEVFNYFKGAKLNANGFQENANGISRRPATEWQPGLLVSGPVLSERLLLFSGLRVLRFQGRGNPQDFALPTTSFVNSTDPASFAGKLLRQYLPESQPSEPGDFAPVAIAPPVELNRLDGIARADYSPRSGSHRLFSRFSTDRLDLPYLVFNPYREFSTAYEQTSQGFAVGVTSQSPTMQNELRGSVTGDLVSLQSAQTGNPQQALQTARLNGKFYQVLLPGSLTAYDYRNRGRTWEVLDNWTRILGQHTVKVGGGFLQRRINLSIPVFPGGRLTYEDLQGFRTGRTISLAAEVDSVTGEPISPNRLYRYRQAYAFAQDSYRASRRLTFDFGVRYDYFGAPANVGEQKDVLYRLGEGPDPTSRFLGAFPVMPSGTGTQPLFQMRSLNWAGRAGLALDLTGHGSTILRAAYGIFYDPMFDNLWQNAIQNRYRTDTWVYPSQSPPLPAPLSVLQAAGTRVQTSGAFMGLLFQSPLRAPRTQSAFVGIQHAISSNMLLKVDGLVSRGRQLITTDIVNRLSNQSGINLDYRANQGGSEYAALSTALQFRSSRLSGQVSYTWSHSIDNQSEPLAGTFLSFNQLASTNQASPYFSSFTQQEHSSADRGNSDFDQRHALVFFTTWDMMPVTALANPLGGILRNWTIATLGAIRSGTPFSVYANRTGPAGIVVFDNERADLVFPDQVYTSQPHPGGKVFLNAAAFARPQANQIGTSGRNAFQGPGLFNLDLSLARTFRPSQNERLDFTIRADAYNLVNHANLNNPSSFFPSSEFGVALYGRREINNGFPLLQPLGETARQIQLLFRVRF